MAFPRSLKFLAAVAAVCAAVPSTEAARARSETREALVRLEADSGGPIRVTISPATGTARFLALDGAGVALGGTSVKAKAMSLFERYGEAFGIEDPARELEQTSDHMDPFGRLHLSFRQVYHGVPVFAAVLRAHFDQHGELSSINGIFVPDISLDTSPTLRSAEAAEAARRHTAKLHGLHQDDLVLSVPKLVVYREGLARGVPGTDRLAWQVEVTDGSSVRDVLFVDSRRGTLIDRIDLIEELNRVIHHHQYGNRIWSEGDPVPFSGIGSTEDAEVNEIILSSAEIFDIFANLTGGSYLSFNGSDAVMHSIYAADSFGDQCPNARWNGRNTEYCPGMAVDDVVAHEWTHAYPHLPVAARRPQRGVLGYFR